MAIHLHVGFHIILGAIHLFKLPFSVSLKTYISNPRCVTTVSAIKDLCAKRERERKKGGDEWMGG